MNRPYIVCHMMSSIDGRVDCAMTACLTGVEEYYDSINELKLDSTLNGRVTAEKELAFPEKFESKTNEIYGKQGFSKKYNDNNYEIIVDTKGILTYPKSNKGNHSLVITSEKVHTDYLKYLDKNNISWIAVGKDKINLSKAMKILKEEFNINRLGIVGGPTINGAFLNKNLLDEVSILIGPGIDGRANMQGLFEGSTVGITPLELLDVKKYDNGAVWLRYKVLK